MKAKRLCSLTTPFESDSSSGWEEDPRPQMKRDSYLSLCGEWELSVEKKGRETALGHIRVPFPPESRLSGVGRQLGRGERYIYRRSFALPDTFDRGRVLLHFGAVDQSAVVFVNGKRAGEHSGGYIPFSLDITDLVGAGANELRVEVTDALDREQPYGKQRRRRGGMWYTPISGIWQPVWLESVPKDYIRSLRLTPALDSITLETRGGKADSFLLRKTCWN